MSTEILAFKVWGINYSCYILKKIHISMNMYKALVISELIEIIFVFLSRKDLYRRGSI